MRITRTVTALVAFFTAAMLGLTMAPSAQATESIAAPAATAEAATGVAARGVTPRTIVIADCRCTTRNPRTKPLWAKFSTNPLAAGVKFKVYVKRGGKWRKVKKAKTNGAGITKKITFRAEGRGKTKYKVVAKGDAVYADATLKVPVTRS
jgi:hypothetical protein